MPTTGDSVTVTSGTVAVNTDIAVQDFELDGGILAFESANSGVRSVNWRFQRKLENLPAVKKANCKEPQIGTWKFRVTAYTVKVVAASDFFRYTTHSETEIDEPLVFNTIDAQAPTSRIEALPAVNSSPFTVRWSGQDDAGPVPWLATTPACPPMDFLTANG